MNLKGLLRRYGLAGWLLGLAGMVWGDENPPPNFNLYSGRPQEIVLRQLVPGRNYRWELKTEHARQLAGGQLTAADDGQASLTLELPKLDDNAVVVADLVLKNEHTAGTYRLQFYSNLIFGDGLAELKQDGVFTDDDAIGSSLTRAGLEPIGKKDARIWIVTALPWADVKAAVAAGKTVVMFGDNDAEWALPRTNLKDFSLQVLTFAKKTPTLSVIYDRKNFTIGNDGEAGLAVINYRTGRLLVAAASLREMVDCNPEFWLLLKKILKGEEKK